MQVIIKMNSIVRGQGRIQTVGYKKRFIKNAVTTTIVDVMSSLVIIKLCCGNHSTFTDHVVDFTPLNVLRLLSFESDVVSEEGDGWDAWTSV